VTVRRLLSLLCLGACAAVLAGCGDTLSFDPVAQAADETASSASARVDFTGTMTVAGAGAMSFNGKGVFDGRMRSGALNMNFQFPPAAQAQLGGVDPSMQMIMDGRDGGIVFYMRSAMFDRYAAGKWLKVDVAAMAKKEGVDVSSLMNAYQADPSENLRMLTASSDAHVVGYERVRGVFATHYTLNIDLKKLAEKTHNKMLDSLRKLGGVDSIPAEAWLDKQNRVRRVKIEMNYGGAFTMTLTEELYAFGIKVDVQPPAASDVVDASALLGG
jgi:hypothetical protein